MGTALVPDGATAAEREPETETAGASRMRPPVFMTGATGFLGMEVLARLLEAGDRDVVVPRARGRRRPPPRRAWTACWRRCGSDPAPYRGRVRAVAGDLTAPGLGIDERRARRAGRGGRRRAALRGLDLVRPPARRGAADQRRGHARGDRLRPRGEGARAPGPLPARLDRVRRRAPTPARSARASSSRARSSATPTSRPSGRPSRSSPRPTTSRPPSCGRASSWGSPTRAGPRPSTSSTGRCGRSRAGCSTRCRRSRDGRVDVVPVDYVADGIVYLLDRARVRRLQPRRGPRGPDGRGADRAGHRSASASRAPSSWSPASRPRWPTARSTCRTST